jgi:hypothetical protein
MKEIIPFVDTLELVRRPLFTATINLVQYSIASKNRIINLKSPRDAKAYEIACYKLRTLKVIASTDIFLN